VRGSLYNCAVRCTHYVPMVTKVEGKLRPPPPFVPCHLYVM
jgi:hypothetical protein